MTTPGFAVWIVTVTWFAERSISMRAIAASRRRERIAVRIETSSLRSTGYALWFAYHLAFQVLVNPRR